MTFQCENCLFLKYILISKCDILGAFFYVQTLTMYPKLKKKILNVILNWVECAKLSKYKTKTMKNEMGKLVQKGIIAAVTNRLLQEEQICLLEKKEKKYHIQLKSMGSQDRSIFWDTLMEVLFKTYVQNYS